MRRVLFVASFAALALSTAPPALAIGFGKVVHPTLLGQPLDFSATVRLDSDEVLERRCVSAEVLSGDNRVSADEIRIGLKAGADPAERIVRVMTLHGLDEPVVTVLVSVGCGSRVSRKFTAFLDPPMVNLARAAEPEAGSGQALAQESQVAPLAALVEAARNHRQPASASPSARETERASRGAGATPSRARSTTTRVARASEATRVRATRRMADARPSTRPAPGPRLRLDAPEPVVARAPAAAASAVASVAAVVAATTSDPAVESLRSALEQERARTQALDAGLARLRTEAAATQQTVALLQARLHEAESARFANSLVYLLGGLCALLTLVAALALRRPRGARARRWFDLTQMPAMAPASDSPAPPPVPEVEGPADQPWVYQPARLPVTASPAEPNPSSIGGLEVTTVLDHAVLARMVGGHEPAANAPLDAGDETSGREPTIDALVDLEQQVDFFLVLGQDEAAIDRLARHCGEGAGPLPYFHLLQIHRRRGEEAAFARVAEDFHRRFGAVAPGWDAPAAVERPIETHARFFSRLQAAWSTPPEAMGVIEDALLRREPADEMPDFAACREMLFLYSVARDRAEQPVAAAIDLLLPMDDTAAEEPPLAVLGSPSHFAALYTLPSRPAPLDLDVSVPAPLEDASSERRQAI